MVELFPFAFTPINKKILITNDTGDFFYSSELFLKRILEKNISERDKEFLYKKGFAFEKIDDFYFNSHLLRLKKRKILESHVHYIIAIPTLRCNLTCSYCQVSRADVDAQGYDWTDDIIDSFKKYLKTFMGESIKIEFQGGEPSLRLDIIKEIVKFCDTYEIKGSYILCTNLHNISSDLKELLNRDDFYISTSIDGSYDAHTNNRTKSDDLTRNVYENYDYIKTNYGTNKISALPTITCNDLLEIKDIIDYYINIGQSSIFLRPVNFQGFARKKYADQQKAYRKWISVYLEALNYIWHINFYDKKNIIETGFEVAIKRIFKPNYNSHVDLRSPNPAAKDYIVINYDGDLYPSDEARMLSRIGHVDLTIGNIKTGLDTKKLHEFNWNQTNEVHEDCIHCAYKPYCGVDTVDDLSRYSRIDVPKHDTYFCKTNMLFFENIFNR